MNRVIDKIDISAEREGIALRRMTKYNPAKINKSAGRKFNFTKTKHLAKNYNRTTFDKLFR